LKIGNSNPTNKEIEEEFDPEEAAKIGL